MEEEIKEVKVEETRNEDSLPKKGWKNPTKRLPEGITEPQKVFAVNYAKTLDAKNSAKLAYPTTKYPAEMGYALKQKQWVKDYISSTMMECAEIQMDMILDKKTPAAVRHDAIKFRLTAGGVAAPEEQETGVSIGDITINVARD
jgi:phage terminase small subunit